MPQLRHRGTPTLPRALRRVRGTETARCRALRTGRHSPHRSRTGTARAGCQQIDRAAELDPATPGSDVAGADRRVRWAGHPRRHLPGSHPPDPARYLRQALMPRPFCPMVTGTWTIYSTGSTPKLAEMDDLDEGRILRSYLTWTYLRRLRAAEVPRLLLRSGVFAMTPASPDHRQPRSHDPPHEPERRRIPTRHHDRCCRAMR